MSRESAQAFVNRMKTDKEFADRVDACRRLEDLSQLLTESGFSFTGDEWQALTDVLTDDELERVAGGTGPACDGNYMDDPGHRCSNNFWFS